MMRSISLLALTLCSACFFNQGYPEMHTVRISSEAVNFTEINSIYDDFNMGQYQFYNDYLLVFSSNRNSQGQDFDLVTQNVRIEVDRERATYEIIVNPTEFYGYDTTEIAQLVDLTRNTCDQLGPQLMTQSYTLNAFDYIDWAALFYAENCDGHFDIVWKAQEAGRLISSFALSQLNTESDDLYPTIVTDSSIYFCSNRNGTFDIFSYEFGGSLTPKRAEELADRLMADTLGTAVQQAISSDRNDKCPHFVRTVFNDYLIFASDRAGGFGGFDLYYSLLKNGVWQQPINFGPEVNSPHDDYRPIVIPIDGLENNMMVFSSNRPGGLGGYDLYYAGVELGPMF
ncbi:MAG: hypothetical protein RJQ14_11820 [Marinoscillum sp.]